MLLGFGVRAARRAAMRIEAQCDLNFLMATFHNYHEAHGHLPPAYIADENGKPMHSWRILILPLIDEQELYDKYDFDEPWNGPNNSNLADQMPSFFCSETEEKSTRFTNIVLITGQGTAFPGSGTTKFQDFKDRLSNTIILTEIGNSKIPWLQPRDINVDNGELTINDPNKLSISAVHWRHPYVLFADSISTYDIHDDIPLESLKALTTIAGGESVTRNQMIDQGFLVD